MVEIEYPRREQEHEDRKPKPLINPGEIQGKLEVTDIRERRDGPGGN